MKRFFERKWPWLVVFNILVVVLLCLKSHSLRNYEWDLSPLESQLSRIETRLKQPSKEPDLSPINENLKQLSQFIQQLQNKDDHQLGELFSTSQVAIQKELKAISVLLSSK